MELALQVIGGYMGFVLVFGWLRGWHKGPSCIKTASKIRRQVVRIDRNTFKVVG